jgi:hypothetical protein
VSERYLFLSPFDQVDALNDGLRVFEATKRVIGLEGFLSAIKGSAHLHAKQNTNKFGVSFSFQN